VIVDRKPLLRCFCRVVEEMVLFLVAAAGYYSGDTRRVRSAPFQPSTQYCSYSIRSHTTCR
jgi:hypothetical protein